MTIQDLITRSPAIVGGGDAVSEAASRMKEKDVGSVVVVDGDDIVGILTDRDIAMRVVALERDPATVTVAEVMTRGPVCLRGDCDVEECVKRMEEHGVRRIPIVDADDRLLGVVSLDDVLMHFGRTMGKAAALIHAEVSGVA